LPMPEDTDSLKQFNAARVSTRPRSPARATTRDQSLDVAKGLGIILVVLGHCLDGLIASGFFPASTVWPMLTVFVIYLFHMPLFFAVSGHLASGKHRPVQPTLAKLAKTIAYPYFLWSILEGLALVYLNKYTTSKTQISVIFEILWAPIVPYWFLYALFFCQVAYLAVRRYSHRVQLAIAIVLFVAPQLFPHFISTTRLVIIPETTRGFLYFILGVISVAQVKQFGRWTAVSATILFVLFATLFYQSHLGGLVAWLAALPAGIAGIVATLAWARLLASRRNITVNALAFCGRYSMSIYVTHIFFTAGVRIALKRLFAGPGATAGAGPTFLASVTEIVAATVIGVSVPLVFNWIVSKFDLDQWLGLQHMETA